MAKLLKEAELDDRFNIQMNKIQDAIGKLEDIIAEMQKPGSMNKPVRSQLAALRIAAEDLKSLHEQMS
jgi:hypothetical protein